jgi:hypothetical protein
VSDKDLSEKLQLRSDLTLKTAIEISEMVKSQIKDQSASTTNVEAVRKHSDRVNVTSSKGRGQRHSQPCGHSRSYGNNNCVGHINVTDVTYTMEGTVALLMKALQTM